MCNVQIFSHSFPFRMNIHLEGPNLPFKFPIKRQGGFNKHQRLLTQGGVIDNVENIGLYQDTISLGIVYCVHTHP